MKKVNKKNIFCAKNIPNILTIIRILMSVAVIALLCMPNAWFIISKSKPWVYNYDLWDDHYYFSLRWLLAGGLFVLASLTDFLDGYLARKYNWISDWGKIWDPLADKVLVNTTLILLCIGFNKLGQIFVIIPIILIVRDMVVDGYRMSALSKEKIVVPANIFGKLKTIFQFIGIITIFFAFNSDGGGSLWEKTKAFYVLQNGILWIACVLSIVSGIIYVCKIKKLLNAKK
ncbi:MAG: CDP-diacylglycerol--glycerol-3-phosphate 3-phosphatidyltransferase [Mycoplasmataceae bacterium]|nr:CDP-diacylglycerol--glycerol-3-phosphate 3-phosphatidyltransferase [Mycoplasmataceae bacterium]